jgi:hypothetical protein
MTEMPSDRCTYELLDVRTLELDLSNPRIAQYVEMYGDDISAEQMSLALGAGDSLAGDGSTTFHSLRESIKTCGRIIHPIIVNQDAEGKHIVIEGNTRVLIYREFLDQGIGGSWTEIPAIVYADLSQADIDAIRLQAHLVGPRQWDPYSKAKYLDHLRNSAHLTLGQIVDYCGGRKKEVSDFIDAFHDMERHYRPILAHDGEFDPSRFSAFVELQNPRVKMAVLDAGFSYIDFARWVKDQLIFPLNTVRQLPRILANDKSRAIFLSDGAQEAIKVLDVPTADAALAEASLAQLAREIAKRIAHMPYSEVQRLRQDSAHEESDMLREAKDSLTQLCSDIELDA